ncbi:MAG TPA: squalene--hopene cyclase [Solirubrobacterales bacterium]|nr:squalene--hopene cyclase [Solirubrobacterales bacterium]
MPPDPSPVSADALETALERARERLLALQDERGWWKGELETNVTMDAEDLLLREFLGAADDETVGKAARWIRSQQRSDGTWANFHDGPPNVSTTIEAYAALRLAGDPVDAPHMAAARAHILREGGLERARVFTHIWLALFGLWSWDDVPALPPELIFLPAWVPLNLYDFACWARQTIAALTIVRAEKPVRPVPFDLEELRAGEAAPPRARSIRGRVLLGLDSIMRRYERHPLAWLRRRAIRRVERWVIDRQEADGSWGGIQPPWVYSLIALSVRGYPLDHPVMRAGLGGIDGFLIDDGRGRRLEACQSPVWDTALAIIALTDAGVEADDPAIVRAGEWLLGEEVSLRGDWAVRRPRLAPGGWAFEFENDHYPDIDDAAEVVIALRRVAHRQPGRAEQAIRRAVEWTTGMQSANGGWGAFDADNVRELCREIPFCDFGEVIDDPSVDVSAHVLEMLGGEGLGAAPAARRGASYVLAEQEARGSWFGRWGVNHVYGTGAAIPGLVACGVAHGDPRIRRAVAWLTETQNEDGGWGEDARSYDDPGWIGRGPSTASQTAWALIALHAAGEERGPAVERGLAWLALHQRDDGSWDEPQYTGTGFPGDFYINYHLYRLTFPLMALGRWIGSGEPG